MLASRSPGSQVVQVQYYVGVLKKVMATPEWKKLMEDGAFNKTALTGKAYKDWLANEEGRHKLLMNAAGFIPAK